MHLDDEPHMAKQLLTASARHPFCETLNRVMPRKVLKLTAEDREILDRIARVPNDEVLRLRFEEISVYLRVIDKIDPNAVRQALEEVCVGLGITNADIRRWAERARWKHWQGIRQNENPARSRKRQCLASPHR
jgi:hypothetical protein